MQGGTLRRGLANLLQAAHQHHLQHLYQESQEQTVPALQQQGGRMGPSGGRVSVFRDGGGSLGVCDDPTLLPFLVGPNLPPQSAPAAAAATSGKAQKAQQQQVASELNMPVQQAAEAETVLRTVWGSSSDPDALHALANQGRAGTEEHLMLMEREGQWPGALAAYDLALLQHTHTPAANPPCAGGVPLLFGRSTVQAGPPSAGGSAGAGPAAATAAAAADASHVHFGVAKALDRMGCGYAAATYLQGAAGPGRQPSLASHTQSEATLELQYELAWRLGHWDSSLPLQGPPTLHRKEATGGISEGLDSAQIQPPLAGTQQRGQGQVGGGRPTGLQLPCLDLSACSPTLDQKHSLQIASSSSSVGNRQDGQMGFHESLLACLCALQVGDRQRFHSVLRSAIADCVRALASTSNEAPAALDQPLERLRCLRLLEDVWHVTWLSQPSLPGLSISPLPTDTSPQKQLLQQLCALADGVENPASCSGASPLNRWGLRGSELGLGGGGISGGHLSSELLDALRCAALRVSGRHGALSCALATGVSDCRSHRSLTPGTAYAQQLRTLLTACTTSSATVPRALSNLSHPMGRTGGETGAAGERLGSGAAAQMHVGAAEVAELAQLAAMLRPDAGWRLDEARLTWQGGQQKVAARIAGSLADAMLALQAHTKAAAAAGDASAACPEAAAPLSLHVAAFLLPPNPLRLASALSLAGKWGAKAQLEELGGISSSLSGSGSSSGGRTGGGGSTEGVLALMTHAAQVAGEQLSVWRASLPPSPPTATSSEATAAMRVQLLPGTNPQAPSSSLSSPSGSVAACKVFHRLATFADARYSEMVAQRSTPEYTAYTNALKKKREKAESMTAQAKLTNSIDTRRTLQNLASRSMQPVLIDEEARRQAYQLELRFRSIALSNYKRCLQAGHLYDLQVAYRLVALWLSISSDPEANKTFERVFEDLPTFKFVPLVYQIASRVSSKEDSTGFQAVLNSLLVRMACDHPYHVLYPLFALKNGSLKNKKLPQDLLNITGGVLEHDIGNDKVEGAQMLLDNAAAVSSRGTRELISQVEQVVKAYCEISEITVDKHNPEPPPIPFPQGIWRRMKLATRVAIVSYQLPVDPTCTYSDIPYMASTDSKITLAGGVNNPKIVKCFDQHGQLHKQLVKAGSDDTRQDAVMQQFFGLVNALLARDREACKRQLGMITYKVVPFSPIAGLIEWVQNTLPMSEYLLGPGRSEGAHRRHQKAGQISYKVAQSEFAAATQKSAEQKTQAYKAICARFPPAMHHFFLESFHQPASWFAARTTYTRSVAVTSMAGWLIGLGDRHSSNILLDTRTAAVVHIDLGVAFEQGQFLRTPELVPFRMTQDVVDGCGISGTEGPLRRSCELTLQVLRSSKEALLQVVEVFIHDPLFKWALSYLKAQKRQKEDRHTGALEEEQQALAIMQQQGHEGAGQVVGNADAERTVLRVKQKLEGVDGSTTAQGVQAQVSSLLAEAQDPDKLSRMYIGWAPWV